MGTRGGDLLNAVVYAPNVKVDWINCIQTRATPKCSTDEASIETATLLMSLKAQQERGMVR